MMSGDPGAQVICSTGWFSSSQAAGAIIMGLPLSLRSGCPASSMSVTDGSRALTEAAGHSARAGA